MRYRRSLLMTACLFFSATLFAQQYPFVHYSPRDGLVSNRLRTIYQDRKGKLYFGTANGLSVYDGARFTNYTTDDGLHNDIVNCIMEMGDDSLWVITNTSQVNCLVKGKLKHLSLRDKTTPIINSLCRDTRGYLYAAADEGMFLFDKDHFIKLELKDMVGGPLTSYIYQLIPYDHYLFVLRDNNLASWDQTRLYLFDPATRKIISQAGKLSINNVSCAMDGRVWIGTNYGIRQLNTDSLRKGKIVAEELPAPYKNFTRDPCYVFFDNQNNCWLSDGTRTLKKCDPSGSITNFTAASGLKNIAIGTIFQDKENTIWMASNEGGLEKLMNSDLSFIEKPFGLSWPSTITAAGSGNELIVYSYREKKGARFSDDDPPETFSIKSSELIGSLIANSHTIFGVSAKNIFRINQQGALTEARVLFTDTSENTFGNAVIDKNDNLLINGINYITSFAGNTISQVPCIYSDQLAFDKDGTVWTATRGEQLIRYSLHPDQPSAYLHQEAVFVKELQGILPRSTAVDNNGMIWIGTRYKGIYIFQVEKEALRLVHHLTSSKGLTDNFISFLLCDDENNIWAASPSGIDKIHLSADGPVIENITRQNNMYPLISSILIDKNKTVWALSPAGLIRLRKGQNGSAGYTPRLMISQVKAGNMIMDPDTPASLSHQQNDLSFNFFATSFLDEKQIQYSYRLQGRGTTTWSEPSNNASASFIGLRPGQYTLLIKSIFPAGRYPDQFTEYKFSIAPPWWQTWWFRLIAASLIIGLLIMSFRFYYRRKLEKQRTLLEKQQAVEKERTRIATDMHDDLGAGLSKIRFLSETVQRNSKEEAQQPHLQNISTSSVELVDKFNEIIWAMNEKNNSLEDLLYYIRSYAAKYCAEHNLAYKIFIPDEIAVITISGEMRRHIFLTVKEALHNVVKHAGAKNVMLKVDLDTAINITIHDDGKGFELTEAKQSGSGIRSMQQRIKNVNGHLALENNEGTELNITVPLPVD